MALDGISVKVPNSVQLEEYLQLVVFQFIVLKTVEKWLRRFC